MYIKKQIKTLYYLDDVSSILFEKQWYFYIEYLERYFHMKWFIDWIKISTDLYNWIIKNEKNSKYFINLINKHNKKDKIIVFEWIENKEWFKKIIELCNNINICLQWFYFDKWKQNV